MLKVDMTLSQVEATPQTVVALHESINMPLVSIPNIGTAPTQAYVLGLRADAASYTVIVVLRQNENDANLVYVSDPRNLPVEQYRVEEQEGLRFVESMGFLMDDHSFRALPPERQAELLERTPIFAGSKQQRNTIDLVEMEEEPASAPEVLDPDPMFGGLENVPMLKGEPASPPTFERNRGSIFPGSSRPGAPVHRPSAPPGPVPGSGRPNPTLNMPRPVGSPPPQPQPRSPALGPEAMARLGRFLSTFVVPIALLAGLPQCAHMGPSPDEPLPQELQNRLDIADHFLSQGQWAEAAGVLKPLAEQVPKSAPIRHGLGIAFMYLDRLEAAEVELKVAIDSDPAFTTAKNTLAGLYMKTGRCEDAAQLLGAVLEDFLYPTPEFAQDNLARAEQCLGKSKEAMTRLQRLLISKPQFCRGYLTLADVSTSARSPEVTIRACDDFHNRCELHEEIGKLVSPENKDLCYLRKGMAHAALGDYDAARQSLARCDSPGTFGQECKKALALLDGP